MDRPMDHPVLNQFLFYPRPIIENEIPDLPNGSIHKFPAGDGEKISAYFYRPLPDAPTALFFHGNGEVITDYIGDMTGLFESIGLNFCVVDYRGYGLSEGSPSLSKLIEDGRAAWKYFTQDVGLNPKDIVLFGRSLGSIPAIDIASQIEDGFRCLVIESGISGLDRWIGRMEPMIERLGIDVASLKADIKQNLDHRAKIQKIKRPILILHTESDSIVPVWNARDLFEWAGPEKSKLRIFEQGDHNSIFYYNGKEYLSLVKNFVGL